MSTEVGSTRSTVLRVLRSGAVGAVGSAVVALTVTPFVISHASLATYGAWATISGLLSIAALSQGGLPTEVARQVAVSYGAGDERGLVSVVRRSISVMMLTSVALLAAAGLVAWLVLPAVFDSPSGASLLELRAVWMASIALMCLTLVLGVWFATLGGLQRHDFGAYSTVVASVVSAVVIVTLASLGFGIWSLFAGALALSFIGWVGPLRGMRAIRPRVPLRPAAIRAGESLRLLRSSSVLLVASIAAIADRQVDKLVLTHFRGSDSAGAFQIAVNLTQQPIALAGIPAGLLLAAAAELHSRNTEKLAVLSRNVARLTYAAGFTLCFAVVAFAGPFAHVWLGSSEPSGLAPVIQVMALSSIPTVISLPWASYCQGIGRAKFTMYAALLTLIVNIVGSVFLTPRYGEMGAAVTSLIGSTAGLFLLLFMLRRTALSPSASDIARSLLPLGVLSLAFVLSPYSLPGWGPLIGVGAGWLFVAAALVLTAGGLPIQMDRRRLLRLTM